MYQKRIIGRQGHELKAMQWKLWETEKALEDKESRLGACQSRNKDKDEESNRRTLRIAENDQEIARND